MCHTCTDAYAHCFTCREKSHRTSFLRRKIIQVSMKLLYGFQWTEKFQNWNRRTNQNILPKTAMSIFQNASAEHTSSDCVFWDFDALDGRGDWSSEGCWYNGSQDGRIICMCDHMTNFAVLAVSRRLVHLLHEHDCRIFVLT